MKRIQIAGTSVGGSSYMNRIVDAINQGNQLEPLLIEITSGDKQRNVERKIIEVIAKLEQTMSAVALKNIKLNYEIVLL